MLTHLNALAKTLSIRARYGVVLILALLGADLTSRLNDAALSTITERQIAQRQYGGANQTIDLSTWRERSGLTAQALTLWQEEQWRGTTPGIIAAGIQSRLAQIGREMGITAIQIEVDPKPVKIVKTQGLRYRVIGRASSAKQFAHFFGSIEELSPRMFTDELSLTLNEDGMAAFELSGAAPIDVAVTPQGGSRAGSEE